MSEPLKYKEGDEIFVIRGGVITDVDEDTPGEEYLVRFEDGEETWVDANDVRGPHDSDVALMPEDYVVLKKGDGTVGQLVALKKGRAWVDWAPFDKNTDVSSAVAIGLLRRADVEEVNQAGA